MSLGNKIWASGAGVAAILSYTIHQDLFWAFVHMLFGWLYIVYVMVNVYFETHPDVLDLLRRGNM